MTLPGVKHTCGRFVPTNYPLPFPKDFLLCDAHGKGAEVALESIRPTWKPSLGEEQISIPFSPWLSWL